MKCVIRKQNTYITSRYRSTIVPSVWLRVDAAELHSAFLPRKKLVLAGVPEQVNIPIKLCLEHEIFNKNYNLDVEYKEVPQGTGALLDQLESNQCDVALTVTDALLVARANGRSVRLAGTYVDSPLCWSVLTAGGASASSMSAAPASTSVGNTTEISHLQSFLREKQRQRQSGDKEGSDGRIRIGISRLGSGSHTMSFYLASLCGIPSHMLDFKVCDNFSGLRSGVTSGQCDIFLWERFTTKPFVDTGELAQIGQVSTPWTAFSFAVKDSSSPFIKPQSESQSQSQPESTLTMIGTAEAEAERLAVIRDRLFPALSIGVAMFERSHSLSQSDDGSRSSPSPRHLSTLMEQRIVREHGHTPEDAREWFDSCRYADKNRMAVDSNQTRKSLEVLKNVGLIEKDAHLSQFV